MANRNSSRRLPRPKSSSLGHDDENGLSTSMQDVRSRRPVSQGQKIFERAQGPMTPTRSNGNRNGDQRRNFAPSTPMDPRSSSRIEKSFMSPTNASASRIVALNPTHARDVHEKSARDTSPHLMPLPGGNKGQNKPMPDSVHLKGDIRTPNGVVSRKQAQKPLTRTQKLDEASFRKLQNARTVQSNAQNRNKAMVRQPKKNSKAQEQREERNGQRFHGGAQSPMEMPVRSRGQPDQIAAFRNSTYGMERQEDFYFPEDFSPDIPERTSSSPGKSVKSPWGLSSLSMFSSSLLKPDIDVEAILEHNRRLDGAVSHWRQENMKLNEDLRQLREVNDQHESDLRELQTKSFKEISKSIWSPLEDHVVRETLENIHKEIEDWAEENSIKTFDDLNESCISDGEAEALLDFLRDIASTDSDNLWGQFRIWGRQEIDPELILTAVITSCMYDQVFRNPFMVLDAFEAEVPCEGQIYAQSQILDDLSELVEDELRVEQERTITQSVDQVADENEELSEELLEVENEGTERESDAGGSEPEYQEDEDMEDAEAYTNKQNTQSASPLKPSTVMLETYQTLKQLNLGQSQLWRSQLMKILFPTPKSGSRFDGLSPADPRITTYLRSHCTILIDNFLRSPARIFLGCNLSEESRSSLIGCWERTIHLFTQLQTQLRLVKWTMPEQLPLAGKLFDTACMDGHCTQTYVSKERVPISLVVSPAVMLLGNEDGQHYDVERVVVKAVVRVDEDEEL